MTVTTLAASLAGTLAAAGLTDLLATRRVRRGPSAPTRLLGALTTLGRRAGVPDAPADLQTRIERAGLSARAGDVMAIKAGAAIAAVAAAVPLASVLPGRLGACALLAAPLAAFLAPDLHLRRRAGRRATRMAAELPDVLDLLRVALSAGVSTTRALHEVGSRHTGVLASELLRTADQIALGLPRDQAYERLGRRTASHSVTPLVTALARADRHGAPPSDTLAALARDARLDHARARAERAAKAAPQIQLVVALLLVPSVLLLVAAALLPSLG